MKLTATSVHRPVLVSMVFLAITVFGGVALRFIPVDLFPEVEPPTVSVITFYPGASAPDVEEKVTERIEDTLGSISDLEELSSRSMENISIVSLRFAFGADLDEAANDIRQWLEFGKRDLPEGADPPMLMKFDMSQLPVVIFAVTSSRGSIHHDRDYVEDAIVEPLKRVPGVGGITLFNAPELQVQVEVDRERLEAQHLTMAHLAQVIAAENVSVPAGQLETGTMEFAVRLPAEFQSYREIEGIVLARRGDRVVRLGDVARVVPSPAEELEIGKMRGRDVIAGMIMKKSGANTVSVVEELRARIDSLQKEIPDHLDIVVIQDTSRFIKLMIGNLARTLGVASLLVIVIVFLFLRRVRPSLIVALAMPASLIIAFALLYLFDYTINMISLMAMALAVGMVVDNAIVVLENITRHVEDGRASDESSVEGTREVGGAIMASTLTTVSIFAPLVFVSGFIGIFFGQLAVVMTATIGASLVTALTLTPMLTARLLKPHPEGGRKGPLQRLFGASEAVFRLIERFYAATLRFSLNHRLLVVLLAVGVMVGSGYALRLVGFDFMPKQNSGEVNITAELPVGTSVAESAKVGARIATILEAEPETREVFYRAGTSRTAFAVALGGKEGPHVVQVMARLVPLGERERTDHEVAADVREQLERMPEIEALTMRVGGGMGDILTGFGKPVVVELYGDDFAALERAAAVTKDIFERTPGLVDISADTFQEKPELQVRVDRERASRLGVPVAYAGLALRQSFYGEAVTRYRPSGEGDAFDGGGAADDVDIFLRLQPSDRATVADIEDVRVPTLRQGPPVRLGDIARVVEGASPVEIKRKDQQRYVAVAAAVGDGALGDIAAALREGIAAAKASGAFPDGVRAHLGGELEEQAETFQDMFFVMVLGFLLVFMVMAGQFESLLDPFVIMFSVPFAITGAFIGLLVSNTSLSIPAFLGVIVLIGVVVNNAIVFVDYVNLLRVRGAPLREALEVSGARRLRPVLMTALTTAMGMLPLALTTGEGAGTWQPLGRAALGGLLLSTFVTLILVPVIYSLTDRIRSKARFERLAKAWGIERGAG